MADEVTLCQAVVRAYELVQRAVRYEEPETVAERVRWLRHLLENLEERADLESVTLQECTPKRMVMMCVKRFVGNCARENGDRGFKVYVYPHLDHIKVRITPIGSTYLRDLAVMELTSALNSKVYM